MIVIFWFAILNIFLNKKISGNKPSECILNLMNILIQEDMEFLQKLEMKLERIEDQLMSHTGVSL